MVIQKYLYPSTRRGQGENQLRPNKGRGSLSDGEGLMNKPTHLHNELEMGPLF